MRFLYIAAICLIPQICFGQIINGYSESSCDAREEKFSQSVTDDDWDIGNTFVHSSADTNWIVGNTYALGLSSLISNGEGVTGFNLSSFEEDNPYGDPYKLAVSSTVRRDVIPTENGTLKVDFEFGYQDMYWLDFSATFTVGPWKYVFTEVGSDVVMKTYFFGVLTDTDVIGPSNSTGTHSFSVNVSAETNVPIKIVTQGGYEVDELGHTYSTSNRYLTGSATYKMQ